MDIENKFNNTNVSSKKVLGEKKRSWWRTGLKMGAGVLGAGLLGVLGSKMNSGNNTPIQQGGGTGNQLIDGVLQQQGRLPPRIDITPSQDFSVVS